MTTVCITADHHIGNHLLHGGPVVAGINRRCQQTLDCLARAVEVARAEGITRFIGAGDLFDVANPPPQVVAAARSLLYRLVGADLILGNHEIVTDQQGDSATEVLGCVATDTVTVWRSPGLVDPNTLLVPHDPARSCLDALAGAIFDADAEEIQLVVAHFGIYDDTDPKHLHGPRSAHIKDLHAVLAGTVAENALVVCGDWHRHRVFHHETTHAVQVGALCPVGWRDPGTEGYGSLLIVNIPETGTPTWRREEIPGPRFLAGPAEKVRKEIADLADRDRYPLHARITDSGHFPPGEVMVLERPPAPTAQRLQARRGATPTVQQAMRYWCRENEKPERIADQAEALWKTAAVGHEQSAG